jgi:hypothetical protein
MRHVQKEDNLFTITGPLHTSMFIRFPGHKAVRLPSERHNADSFFVEKLCAHPL